MMYSERHEAEGACTFLEELLQDSCSSAGVQEAHITWQGIVR
jgi:hypothetical protein